MLLVSGGGGDIFVVGKIEGKKPYVYRSGIVVASFIYKADNSMVVFTLYFLPPLPFLCLYNYNIILFHIIFFCF